MKSSKHARKGRLSVPDMVDMDGAFQWLLRKELDLLSAFHLVWTGWFNVALWMATLE